MKVHIITIHCIHNFGSVYQSMALQHFISSLGYDCDIIDYRPNYYFAGRNIVKKILAVVLNLRSYVRQHKQYENFINRNLCLTEKRFLSYKDLMIFYNSNDIFVSGGDQIWNNYHPCGNDDAYKLSFVKNGYKFAFGTSVGRCDYSPAELLELSYKIKDFRAIGLREQSTIDMLMPYIHSDIYHSGDPVLLLSSKAYSNRIGKRIIKEPYLLMYLADESELLSSTIQTVVENKDLKVVHVCGFTRKCKCDYFLKSTGPEELLNLLYYSSYVVSASFHATLFSLLFEKDFCTLLPSQKTNARISDLLTKFNLKERIVKNEYDIERIVQSIDYKVVTPLVESFATQTRKKISSLLSDIHE